MKLRYKIITGFFTLLTVAIISLAITISHTAECPPSTAASTESTLMKAIVYRCYGSPDVLEYTDIAKPVPKDNEVLVNIKAAAINPLDWHYMRGSPYLMRLLTGLGAPKHTRIGTDFSGVIAAVGKNVKQFKIGDSVFGGKTGAFAEYLVLREDQALALKPDNISFQQSASVGIAGVTALQALRDEGQLKAGQKVLINGASGGVGTFAVQIAKSLGAEVTGVCSTRNVEMVRSIGADLVVDYKMDDYTQQGIKYDIILDLVGNHSLLDNKNVLVPNGKLLMVGGAKGDWIAPLMGPIKALLLQPFVDQEFKSILAKMSKDDISTIADLMQAGKVTPVTGQHFKLSEVPKAMRLSETGHARGKIIIEME